MSTAVLTDRLLPQRVDNTYRGCKLALWLFCAAGLMKLAMFLNSMFNGLREGITSLPLTVFEMKGVPAICRERIEAAVDAGGKHVAAPHEAWIAADPFRGGFKDDDPAVIFGTGQRNAGRMKRRETWRSGCRSY
jgi:hypothetical protein